MDISPADARHRVAATLTAVMPTLLGLDALGRSALPPDIAEDATEAVFDELAKIGNERSARTDPSPIRPEVPIAAAFTDENLARGMLGRPFAPPGKTTDPVAARLAEVQTQLTALVDRIGAQERPKGPPFSVAAETFIAGRIKTYGKEDHPEIRYLRACLRS